MGKSGNDYTIIVTDDDRFNLPGPMNEQADTPVEFRGYGGQRAGCFPAEDLLGTAFSLRKPFKISELFGFKPSGISGDSRDGITLLNNGWKKRQLCTH